VTHPITRDTYIQQVYATTIILTIITREV